MIVMTVMMICLLAFAHHSSPSHFSRFTFEQEFCPDTCSVITHYTSAIKFTEMVLILFTFQAGGQRFSCLHNYFLSHPHTHHQRCHIIKQQSSIQEMRQTSDDNRVYNMMTSMFIRDYRMEFGKYYFHSWYPHQALI